MTLFPFFDSSRSRLLATLLFLASSAAMPCVARAGDVPAVLDDFSDPVRTSLGHDRIAIDDASVGGASRLTQTFKDGVLSAEGEIVPARGQPGWVSLVLLLTPDGKPADLSHYEGVRVRVRVRTGTLSVSANSTSVTNYDYHAAVIPPMGDAIQEVRIPFDEMKRAWSEQTPLNRATIASVSLVAVGIQKGAVAYDVDEVGFY